MSFTTNPRADQLHPSEAPQESTGAITSDSLAAESVKSGGAFSENDGAVPQSVKGSNSTFNTTDTSGATVLQPAEDGAERERQNALGLGSDERGTSGVKYPGTEGQPDFEGTHTQEGYSGGSANTGSGYQTTTGGTYSGATGDSFADTSRVTGSSTGNTSGISSGSDYASQGQGDTSDYTSGGYTSMGNQGSGDPLATGGAGEAFGSSRQPGDDTAPNYAATVSGGIRSEGELKPKGDNLTEGDIPETKTFTGDVGGQHDPGRVAEQGFNKLSAENSVSAGQPKYQGSGADGSTGGKFDVLESERA